MQSYEDHGGFPVQRRVVFLACSLGSPEEDCEGGDVALISPSYALTVTWVRSFLLGSKKRKDNAFITDLQHVDVMEYSKA